MNADTPTLFHIEKLTYKHILNIDSLQIPAGKLVCICGKSGSGKTTFLKMLNRMLTPDSGIISYKNHTLDNLNIMDLRREVPMLGQTPVMFGGTIFDNLMAGLRFSQNSIGEKQMSEESLKQVLQKLQITQDLDTPTSVLSGGEKQRLAIGRILLMETPVCLMDEPSSALDDGTEDLVLSYLLQNIHQKGLSVIMVTHSKRITETFGEKILELSSRGFVQ